MATEKKYCEIFAIAQNGLVAELNKLDFTKNVIIKGSGNFESEKQPLWSDLDISVVVESVNTGSLESLAEVYAKFSQKHPEIKLSLTAIDTSDNYNTNPFHHHGIKPVAYNFELVQQTDVQGFSEMSLQPNEDVVRISSIYRYYEILYDLRKCAVTGVSSQKYVSRGFHRIARLIRTEIEIIQPSLVYQEGKIEEEKFFRKFGLEKVVGDFFEKKRVVKQNWQKIMYNPQELTTYKTYLIEKLECLHLDFVPRLKEIAKRYARQ